MRVPDANTGATRNTGLLPFVLVIERDGLASGDAFGKVTGFADTFDRPVIRLFARCRYDRLCALSEIPR